MLRLVSNFQSSWLDFPECKDFRHAPPHLAGLPFSYFLKNYFPKNEFYVTFKNTYGHSFFPSHIGVFVFLGVAVLESPGGGSYVLSVLSNDLIETSTNGSKVLLKLGKEKGPAEQVWAK